MNCVRQQGVLGVEDNSWDTQQAWDRFGKLQLELVFSGVDNQKKDSNHRSSSWDIRLCQQKKSGGAS